MSLNKSANRRLSLLAGASLFAASLIAAAGVAIAPSSASAQSVCTPTPSSGAGTNNVTYNDAQGPGITCTATGNLIVNIPTGHLGNVHFEMPLNGGVVDFSGVSGGGATLNFTGSTPSSGRWLATGDSVFSAGNDTLNMNGVGESIMAAGSSISFGDGNDTFNMSAFFGMGGLSTTGASIDFGAGTDALNMTGVFSPSGQVILANLEAFNSSGVIYMGPRPEHISADLAFIDWTRTDRVADDVLKLSSGTFTGSGDSRVVMDVLVGVGGQAGCATLTGAADCLDLRGASTAGTTLLTLNDINTDDATQGGYDPVGITLVDVAGAGTSAAGHFVLDPQSEGYVANATFGGVIIRPGLFGYTLRYDAANQRHALVGVPRSEAVEYAMLSGAAQSIWYMTADAITDRQSDLRAATEGGQVWVRTSGEYTKQDIATGLDVFGDSFAFDNSYKLYAGTIIGGMDFISGRSGDYDYVVGGQLGYVGSSFDLNASESSGRMTGATGGLYASAWNGRVFLDGTFNANGLALDYDSPGLGSKTTTYLNSVGAKLEGGRRFMLSERMFLDPLATVAYVNTGFEEISLDGGEVQVDDAQSVRGALGLRIGGEAPGQSLNVSYFLTGRAWNEFKGETGIAVSNPGDDLIVGDDLGGSFTEAEAGISLYNAANTLSGFLTAGVKAADGYSAVNLSLGLNVRW